MHHADQHVLILTESQQRDSDERLDREVESQPRQLLGAPPRFLSRAASGWSEMSVQSTSKGAGSWMTWKGWPSAWVKTVRRTSWRRIISVNVCANASLSSAPVKRTAVVAL